MLNDLILALQGQPSLFRTLFPSFFLDLLLRRLCRSLSRVFLALLLAVPAGTAIAAELALILSDDGPANTEFAETLKRGLTGSAWTIREVLQEDALAAQARRLQNVDLWVSVGSAAFRTAASQPGPPLLATLISKQSYEQIQAEHPGLRSAATLSAILLDQPLERQLRLIRIVLPQKKSLGLLSGPEGRAVMARTRKAAEAEGFEVASELVEDELEIVPALSRLFARSEMLLALPDPLAFGRNSVRPVLLTSYRYQRPVIGFSAGLVNAGALAAVYSTPGQLARQTTDFLLTYPGGRKNLPPTQHPRDFAVSVNRQVARSLSLDVPENTVLQRLLETGRKEP